MSSVYYRISGLNPNLVEHYKSILPSPSTTLPADLITRISGSVTSDFRQPPEFYYVDSRFSHRVTDLTFLEELMGGIAESHQKNELYQIPQSAIQAGKDAATRCFFYRVFCRKVEEIGKELAHNNPYPLHTPLHRAWIANLRDHGRPLAQSENKQPCKEMVPALEKWKLDTEKRAFQELRIALTRDIEKRNTHPHCNLQNFTFIRGEESRLKKALLYRTGVIFLMIFLYAKQRPHTLITRPLYRLFLCYVHNQTPFAFLPFSRGKK